MPTKLNSVTMHGNALTLAGDSVEVGSAMPDCELTGNDLSPVKLSSFKGKVCVLSVMPSLDTPVCDTMAKRFSDELAKLDKSVKLLGITMDLPFAQSRWCVAAEADNIETLSDHRTAEFGNKFGVLVKDARLLARAVFVVDAKGIIKYIEVVPELTNEPDYDAALKAVKGLL